MSDQSKEKIRAMLAKEITAVCQRADDVKKSIHDSFEDAVEYLNALIAQIPQSASGPLISKTPKALRRKGAPKIKTIPEDDAADNNTTLTLFRTDAIKVEDKKLNETITGRTRREASKKADDIIKKQQSLSLVKKLRRPSEEHDVTMSNKSRKEDRLKRRKSVRCSSDEDEDGRRPTKHSKLDIKQNEESRKTLTELQVDATMSKGPELRRSAKKRSSLLSMESEKKKSNVMDETVTITTTDEVEEPSMYEDAIGKPTPIMNSTMKPNSTVTLDKMMNVTVVLEALPRHTVNLNETVTLNKKLAEHSESSPDARRGNAEPKKRGPKPHLKKERKMTAKQKRDCSNLSSDDEVVGTPTKSLREPTTEIRGPFKSSALFSPYAKESVRKRVEAFEQAGMNSVNVDAPTRLTRTKARAIAAAEAESGDSAKVGEKNVAQKLARKSLARAKKISLAKQIKHTEESKENKAPAQKVNKLASDKLNAKPQQRATPMEKIKTQLPMSVNRNQHTPANNQNMPNIKPITGSRVNIVTSVDSFVQPAKSANKPNSAEKFEEKRRNEEDARRKREEAFRLQTEEKRRKRQEKELKNKLAREAKEKLQMEKRLRTEKEREEKARLAQQLHEKQKEELERKKLAQLLRAQEKEERRRLEEQQRLQRLQEQEEAERMLAEQRRREQEAERRKEAEIRAQMHAAAEAMKHQSQMPIQAKMKQPADNKHHGPTNYILDSEPDDDESDDESRPKHVIPYWAQPHVRKAQLVIQRQIPEQAVFEFFNTKKCTPDLTELFHGIDRSRLERSSSAIWKTPPRYSMMDPDS